MVWPTAAKVVAAVVFTTVSAGACAAVIVALTAGEITAPDFDVALLVSEPASTSLCWIV